MVNPYESPAGPCYIPAKPVRVLALVLGVVLINVLFNVRDWQQMTVGMYVIRILLWLVLPVFAVFLLWRTRSVGRWILIVLFGIRALAMLLFFATSGAVALVTRIPSMLLLEPCRTWVLELAFYFAAATWFFASPSIRQLSGKRRGQTSVDARDTNPHPQSSPPPGSSTSGPRIE